MLEMGSRSSPDSLNGLKFGQKIYFGDVGLGVSGAGGGGGSGSSSSSSSAGKKGRTAPQSGQPPRCQVEGCDLDLSDAKAYYSRHKVCSMHSKYTTVIVGGIQQRFCQQCSRFHQLAEFDSEKRSCRRRLAGHNERRRKPPAGSLMSSRMGRMSPSVFDSSSSSSGTGFLVDFTASLKTPQQSAWPGTKARANHSSEAGKFVQGAWPGGPHPGEMYLHGSAGVGTTTTTTYQVGPSIPSGECFAGVTDSSCALSLLSNQGWSSVNRASPNNLGGQSSSVAHFPWDYKVGEAASHGMQSDLGGLLPHHHPLSSRTPGDELDMAQPGGSYASSTDHMNWLL